jgi:NAD(P)H-dependent flavin oxidoreductase YrpB (nitropropane dioxygenase family)
VTSLFHTPICDLFGVQYPIVQTGMGWVAGPRLTSATSEAGGLGILAAATMTLVQLADAIDEVKQRTTKPFGVNLRTDQADIQDRVKLLIDHGVKVASFAQAPSENLVARLKEAGVVTMPTVGARRHAEKVEKWGVDAVIAQGQEGGGHTGMVPTSLLLPEVCDQIDIPVLGAGGFFDGRGLIAALAYGAGGIAMGTRFLLTQESTVPNAIKEQYLKTQTNGTVITRAIDGHPQRVIRTQLVQTLEKANWLTRLPSALINAIRLAKQTETSMMALIKEGLSMRKTQDLEWSQLLMAANAPILTRACLVDGQTSVGVLPSGQVVGVINSLPTVKDVIDTIMSEAEQTLASIQSLGTQA